MNWTLSQHISRLLFDHECVIVPGYGAFLSRYHPAEVNQATHMMRPPSRRVYFNAGLQENDGLLAKSISLSEKCSYKDALDGIREEIAQWKETLGRGEKVHLPGIGRLFRDEKLKLQFSPSLENNFQRASYGLAIFRSPALEREAKIRKSIQKSIEKHVPKEEKVVVRRFPWAAVLVPLAFAGIVGAAYYGMRQEPLQNMSGLTWIGLSHSSAQETRGDKDATETELRSEKKNDAAELASEAPAKIENKSATRAPAEEIPMAQIYPFHIIVGSFKGMANAESYIAELNSRGYDAYLANGNKNFSRVAIGNFATRAQAENALTGIRQTLNSQAWIYSN